MIYTPLTQKAMLLAYDAHHGQLDKGGVPYIFHPIHLAEQMPDELTTIVALLHDVVEDTDLTLDDIVGDFPPSVIDALRLLTTSQAQIISITCAPCVTIPSPPPSSAPIFCTTATSPDSPSAPPTTSPAPVCARNIKKPSPFWTARTRKIVPQKHNAASESFSFAGGDFYAIRSSRFRAGALRSGRHWRLRLCGSGRSRPRGRGRFRC